MNETPKGEIIIYSAAKGRGGIEVKLQDETVWLNQAQMAELFCKDKRTVSEHIRNIFKGKGVRAKTSCPEFPDNCP